MTTNRVTELRWRLAYDDDPWAHLGVESEYARSNGFDVMILEQRTIETGSSTGLDWEPLDVMVPDA